jgi:Family of unknown function (DUF5995)
MGGRARCAVLLVVVAGLLACAAPARADSLLVPNLNWTSLLPPGPATPTDPQPGPVPFCETPSMACVDSTIARLEMLRDSLGCDHRAVFATTYLELTKHIKRLLTDEPEFLDDPDYLFTEDALFANFYFDTFEAWEDGDRADVPPAWRIAFEQAAQGQITGAQEMLLGINAHVQNDMPFVIAALGVREPDGTSRKPDHDAMNEALNRAYEDVISQNRDRYDPTMTLTNTNLVTVDNIAGLELARTWRELVWRNAERLLTARTDEQRQRIAGQIEANAAGWAAGIAAVQIPEIRESRDAYCLSQ